MTITEDFAATMSMVQTLERSGFIEDAQVAAEIRRLFNDRAELLEALQGVLEWGNDNGKSFKLTVGCDSNVYNRMTSAIDNAMAEVPQRLRK